MPVDVFSIDVDFNENRLLILVWYLVWCHIQHSHTTHFEHCCRRLRRQNCYWEDSIDGGDDVNRIRLWKNQQIDKHEFSTWLAANRFVVWYVKLFDAIVEYWCSLSQTKWMTMTLIDGKFVGLTNHQVVFI